MSISPVPLNKLALVAVAGLLGVSVVLAASPGARAAAQARYQQDLAVCNSGQSNQDLSTCRLEAQNALAAAKRGDLSNASGEYQSNALQRCAVFKDAERSDCEARMSDQSNTEGSAASGGILHQSVTIMPVK